MSLWAKALAEAHDHILVCPDCGMSYYLDQEECPYCECRRPAYFLAKTVEWAMVLQVDGACGEMPLPHRLFNPFSLEHGDDIVYEASVDYEKRQVRPVRGTSKFPEGITFTFVEESLL